MSGMHSTFSSSVTGDNRHSYAVLSALQQGSGTGTTINCNTGSSGSRSHRKDADAASVSSFGSSISLLRGKLHSQPGSSSSSSSSSIPSVPKKSSSLAARQRAAESAEAQTLRAQTALCSSIRNDL